MSVKTAKEVIDFWFSKENEANWFVKSDEFDNQIQTLFGDTYEAAHAKKLEGWMDKPEDALALVILLDQFPRNMFRGSPRSFESNDLALDYARRSLDREYDKFVEPGARMFFYLPYEHSENMDDQNISVKLFEELGDKETLDYAIAHRDIIERFGRFPHRNAVLGRPDTPEETEFMKTHKGF